MKTIYSLFALLTLSIGIKAQVALDESSQTSYKTIAFANGSDSNTIIGSNNIDPLASESHGDVIEVHYWTGSPSGPAVIPHNISAAVASTLAPTAVGGMLINWDPATVFEYTITASSTFFSLNVSFVCKFARADTNQDGWMDAYYTEWTLPQTQADNIPLPDNRVGIFVRTPELKNVLDSSLLLPSKVQQKEWRIGQWEETSSVVNPGIPAWIVGPLSIREESEKDRLSIYPIPSNNFIIIQDPLHNTERFEYKIIDLTGRIVSIGNAAFNQEITIENLTKGTYIIEIEYGNIRTYKQKWIKN